MTRDPAGKLESRAYFSTEPEDTAEAIVTEFLKRWSIETTFEECRAHLGLETQRQWSDAAIECYALQHVRPLVDAAGWGSAFANEIALHGWEISYRRLPARFRTSRCRDRGLLDLHPGSTAWP